MQPAAGVARRACPAHRSPLTAYFGAMPYAVKEIFYTLQGEGAHAGRPAVFCRFAGCNLWTGREADRAEAICDFCDTDFVGTDGPGGGKFATAAELARAVDAAWPAESGGGTEVRRVHRRRAAAAARRRRGRRAARRRGSRWRSRPTARRQPPAGPRLDLREPEGRRRPAASGRRRAQAGLPPGRGGAGAVRGARVPAFLPAADGRPRTRGQHARRAGLLPGASALAAKPSDA